MAFGNKFKDVKLKKPKEVISDLLRASSGASYVRELPFDIFYKIIAFYGVEAGVGTSTMVANTALALAKLGLNVAVFDTSMLAPSQDVLLKTNYRDKEEMDRVDWFDISGTKKSVLNISKMDKKISVLSFTDRDIKDMLSTKDTADLVSSAISEIMQKVDIILIDMCHEQSSVAAACLQQSHKVIQLWSNAPHVLMNIPKFLLNCGILSCPLDKMRNVITSMTVDDIPTNWDSLLNKYKLTRLGHSGMSLDIARAVAAGQSVYDLPSKSEDIQEFSTCITDIVCHLLNISDDKRAKGRFTAQDIVDGKVDGTLSKKYKELEPFPVTSTLEQADNELREAY